MAGVDWHGEDGGGVRGVERRGAGEKEKKGGPTVEGKRLSLHVLPLTLQSSVGDTILMNGRTGRKSKRLHLLFDGQRRKGKGHRSKRHRHRKKETHPHQNVKVQHTNGLRPAPSREDIRGSLGKSQGRKLGTR